MTLSDSVKRKGFMQTEKSTIITLLVPVVIVRYGSFRAIRIMR